VEVAAQETLSLEVALQPIRSKEEASSKSPLPVAPTHGPRDQNAQRAVFWSSVGVGTVGLGTGIAGGILFATASKSAKNLGEEVDQDASGNSSVCSDPTAEIASSCTRLEKAGRRRDVAGNL